MNQPFVVNLGENLNVGVVVPKVPPPALARGMRAIVRCDGRIEPVDGPKRLREISRLIGCDNVEHVNLRQHGLVMLVDETGSVRSPQAPLNPPATALYHSVCKPGTTWPVRGDVFICPDDDFS